MAQFAVTGLVATALIGLVAVAVMRRIGASEAIRDAKRVTRLAGEGIVEPNLSRGVLSGDPEALRALDRVVRARVLRDGIVRVKLWTADGRIVYSDEPRLIGARYAVDPADRAALRSGGVEAEVSDLSRPENRFERTQHKLLEVYLPIRGPDGVPLRFEAYQRFSSVAASGRRLWLAFAPALLAAHAERVEDPEAAGALRDAASRARDSVGARRAAPGDLSADAAPGGPGRRVARRRDRGDRSRDSDERVGQR